MDADTINLRSIAKHERDHFGRGAFAMLIEYAADEIERLKDELNKAREMRGAVADDALRRAIEDERESCAKIATEYSVDEEETRSPEWYMAAEWIASDIRARSNSQ